MAEETQRPLLEKAFTRYLDEYYRQPGKQRWVVSMNRCGSIFPKTIVYEKRKKLVKRVRRGGGCGPQFEQEFPR